MVLRQYEGANWDSPSCSWLTDRYRNTGSPTPPANLPISIKAVGQIYEIFIDAITKALATPAENCTLNISKDASVASQSVHASESTFNIPKDALTQPQATLTLQSTFNIDKNATSQALALILLETTYNISKTAETGCLATPSLDVNPLYGITCTMTFKGLPKT